MVLENHGCEPFNLQPVQMLGRVQDHSQDGENTDESLPTVNTILLLRALLSMLFAKVMMSKGG